MDELQISVDSLIETEVSAPPQSTSINKKNKSNFLMGLDVYFQGLLAWRLWVHMALTDIRRRYRRTLIGPFWVTLSIAIFIGSMGVVFPILWHTDMKSYLPFFSSGFIIWTFVSSIITEACGTYTDSVTLIKQTALPYSVYANNVVTRNLIVLFHHLTIYVLVALIFSVPVTFNTLLFIPGIVIICLTSSWLTILLGLIASRYRDVKQIVSSVLQVSMFITPILWSASQLGNSFKAKLLIGLNPLYHFIQIVRAPLLGILPSTSDWVISIAICMIGWMLTLRVLGKYKKHLVFWL